MPKEVNVSDEILYYISEEDFNKLVSSPDVTELDVDFKEMPSLKSILAEFGY